MKIPHLQCCFSNKTSKRIKFHSPSLLISDRLKSSQQKKTEFVTIFSCPEQNTLNITEPSNLPRYPHDYTPLTKPRLKDKHHWYWNPYDFFWGDVSSKTGVTNPRGNHHHRWSLRPSYVITMAVMATASLSNLPRGSCDPQFDPPWHGIKPHLWK